VRPLSDPSTSLRIMTEEVEVVARAAERMAGGYLDAEEVAEVLSDEFLEDAADNALTEARLSQIVTSAWQSRLTEQATWPERTDPDSIEEAFARLDTHGIAALEDFTCCASCGHTEIWAQMDDASIGYVFFHEQATSTAVSRGELNLYYGALDPERVAEVARSIVAELARADLTVAWDGNTAKAIAATPIAWLRRIG
jgi:hypothetical protein